MPVAIITGASRGLGLALARSLAADGWNLVIDARDPHALRASAEPLGASGVVRAVPGDVADGAHRAALVAAADRARRHRPARQQRERARPVAPAARSPTTRSTCSRTSSRSTRSPRSHSPSSRSPSSANDAASSSTSPPTPPSSRTRVGAATDRRRRRSSSSATCSAPRSPLVHVYTFDPGDMRTQMHQEAFPGEDISDRPEPETVVPALLRLLHDRARERPLPRRRLRDDGETP